MITLLNGRLAAFPWAQAVVTRWTGYSAAAEASLARYALADDGAVAMQFCVWGAVVGLVAGAAWTGFERVRLGKEEMPPACAPLFALFGGFVGALGGAILWGFLAFGPHLVAALIQTVGCLAVFVVGLIAVSIPAYGVGTLAARLGARVR